MIRNSELQRVTNSNQWYVMATSAIAGFSTSSNFFQAHSSRDMPRSSTDVHMSRTAASLQTPMRSLQPDRPTPSPMPLDPPIPISLSQPEIRTSPSLPSLTQAGHPVRNYQLPKRYHPDPLPEPPRPAVLLDNAGAQSLRILPRINLIVRDTFMTIRNSLGFGANIGIVRHMIPMLLFP